MRLTPTAAGTPFTPVTPTPSTSLVLATTLASPQNGPAR
jgi:hypothetical protein